MLSVINRIILLIKILVEFLEGLFSTEVFPYQWLLTCFTLMLMIFELYCFLVQFDECFVPKHHRKLLKHWFCVYRDLMYSSQERLGPRKTLNVHQKYKLVKSDLVEVSCFASNPSRYVLIIVDVLNMITDFFKHKPLYSQKE